MYGWMRVCTYACLSACYYMRVLTSTGMSCLYVHGTSSRKLHWLVAVSSVCGNELHDGSLLIIICAACRRRRHRYRWSRGLRRRCRRVRLLLLLLLLLLPFRIFPSQLTARPKLRQHVGLLRTTFGVGRWWRVVHDLPTLWRFCARLLRGLVEVENSRACPVSLPNSLARHSVGRRRLRALAEL